MAAFARLSPASAPCLVKPIFDRRKQYDGENGEVVTRRVVADRDNPDFMSTLPQHIGYPRLRHLDVEPMGKSVSNLSQTVEPAALLLRYEAEAMRHKGSR